MSLQRKFNTSAQTSKIMASIKSTDTRPEMLLRKNLWKQGIRGYRKYPKLLGRPDFWFPVHRLVVFIDGCFWHGCPSHCRVPKKNYGYWIEKIANNRRRDFQINEKLQSTGFAVLRIWEHEINGDVSQAAEKIKNLLCEVDAREHNDG